MERKVYLDMCLQASLRKNKNLPENLFVKWKNLKYIPYSYILHYKFDGSIEHVAMLMDVNLKSTLNVPLKEIERNVE